MELYPYQKKLADKIAAVIPRYGYAYIAAAPRTGKTATSLTVANMLDKKSVLFVTKLKAISSIKSDFEALGYSYNLEIINYESVHKTKSKYDLIILDEAHTGLGAYPKSSKIHGIIKKLVGNTDVIFLSGTPSPESYAQLYHQITVHKNSIWSKYSNFYKWAKDYVDITQERRGLYMVNIYDNARISKIKQDIKPIFFTLTQEEANFKTVLQEKFIYCDIKSDTLQYIKKLMKDRVVYINDCEVLADTPAKLSQKVHQLIGGTIKTDEQSFTIDKNKAEAIKNKFKDEKIVIFYKFKQEFELLKEVFVNSWTSCPDDFKNNSKKVFLGQYQSAREGINLSIADNMIFYNLDYSAVSYFQAKERLTTATKEKPITLWWIFSNSGIEKKIHAALSDKKDFTLSYFKDMFK